MLSKRITESQVDVDIRIVKSDNVSELYITAVPTENLPIEQMWQQLFSAVKNQLIENNANILQERAFATKEALAPAAGIRSEVYADIDDDVPASFLVCKPGLDNSIAGVQVHAVICETAPDVISLDGEPCGRIFAIPNRKYITLSAICGENSDSPAAQSKTMLLKAEAALKQHGGDLLSVPRTWMWLGDVLSWYDDFNDVRNKIFTDRGILGKNGRQTMPASTGIGLGPDNGCSCSMDLAAVIEPENATEYIQVTGKQQCAFEYGSAFSRAAKVSTPAAETVFISGTASIDESGATTNLDDNAAQVKATIENVQVILRDMNCGDEDVVQMMAYCKTQEVQAIVNELKDSLPYPWMIMICDVCRDDLLFEIEATAIINKD